MKTVLNTLILGWLLIGPLCWILRDGLGPSSVDSMGSNAIVRFLFTFYWGPVLVALALLRLLAGWFHQNKQAQKSSL